MVVRTPTCALLNPLLETARDSECKWQLVGEFWYDLSLLAEAAPAEEIAPLECELGRTNQETSKKLVTG